MAELLAQTLAITFTLTGMLLYSDAVFSPFALSGRWSVNSYLPAMAWLALKFRSVLKSPGVVRFHTRALAAVKFEQACSSVGCNHRQVSLVHGLVYEHVSRFRADCLKSDSLPTGKDWSAEQLRTKDFEADSFKSEISSKLLATEDMMTRDIEASVLFLSLMISIRATSCVSRRVKLAGCMPAWYHS